MESYPSGPVTRYGIELFKEGVEPLITYTDADGTVAFYLNGGLAPWPGVTEGAVLAEGMDGLHPHFQHLDHKGARQDGATWADTVYDPAEMTMQVTLTANTPENFRKLVRRWFAAWDPERPGRLSWVTPDGGEWWCYPRLFRSPPEKLERGYSRQCKQTFTWSIRNDDAFWRSVDSTSQFNFQFKTATDEFQRDDEGTLGANWQQTYTPGDGAGVCETEDAFFGNLRGRCRWVPEGTAQRTVVNRWLGSNTVQLVTVNGSPTSFKLKFGEDTTSAINYPASASEVESALEAILGAGNVSVSADSGGPYEITFIGDLAKQEIAELKPVDVTGGTAAHVTVATTSKGMPATSATDKQVITLQLGDFFQFPFPDDAFIDIWGRMDDDDATPTGIRLRIGNNRIRLSAFVAGVEEWSQEQWLILPPIWREFWTLECGTLAGDRVFVVKRSGFPILTYKETGTTSGLGANYRGAGFGMEAGNGISRQVVPPSIVTWSMGDNATVTQSGFLTVTNFGDQTEYPDLVVYGPGTFKFGNGPGTEPLIEFGPLADNQVAFIKTRPGERAVYDITADHSLQDLPAFQEFIKRLISLAFNGNIPPLMEWFQSLFGIPPQQGNLYRLLKGRWTRGVPPRPVIGEPETAKIAVEVTGGNADTKVIASLTPRRRWPE